MALIAVEIPKVGLVMENARLVRWLKNVGDFVRQGEPLLELETEKSTLEIESAESGRLVEILLHADQPARVGDRIAWLDNEVASTGPEPHGPLDDQTENNMAPAEPSTPAAAALRAPLAAGAGAGEPMHRPHRERGEREAGDRIRSSPAARRLAAQHGLDLHRLHGTGPKGRVQLRDVQHATAALSSAGAQPLSRMRRALARSMTVSNATIPQFVVERAVDWTALQARRAQLAAQLPAETPRLSVNDFLLHAIARSLLACPALNATFVGEPDSPDARLLRAHGAHIGLVVAVDDGLLVPVLHDVERLGLIGIARQRREIVARALQGKLKREELQGATISLSNLGAHGPDRFTALVNPPQAAILAVGRERDCVVAREDRIQVRPMAQLTLSVDHRVADGRVAADFMASLATIIEGDVWPAE